MRLIDADRLYNERPEYLNPVREGREEYNKGWNACIEMFCKLIDNQPTAFDVSEKDNAIDINDYCPQYEQTIDWGEAE